MPWSVVKGGGCPESKPFAVMKEGGGKVACHATEDGAKAQVRALYAAEKAMAEGDPSSPESWESVMLVIDTAARIQQGMHEGQHFVWGDE